VRNQGLNLILENRKSEIGNRKSEIENRKSKIENRKSKIENRIPKTDGYYLKLLSHQLDLNLEEQDSWHFSK
jgi:hypothetical protein